MRWLEALWKIRPSSLKKGTWPDLVQFEIEYEIYEEQVAEVNQ